jgi:arylsulfatase
LVFPHRYRTLAGRPGGRDGIPTKYENVDLAAPALYDLRADIGEKNDVAAAHPEIVKRLHAFAEKCRDDLGDSLTKRTGKGSREPGRVAAAGKK